MPRILLVDDDPTFRRRLAALLEEEVPGVEIQESTTARAATERGLLEPWSLILLDIRLPDGSGVEVLSTLQAARPELPVVMISGLPATPYGDIMLRLGARGYVLKDRAPEELLPVINRVMRSVP